MLTISSIPAPEASPRSAPPRAATPPAAPAVAPAAPMLPNPSLRLDPGLGIVVLEFRSGDGTVTQTMPTERELEAYRTAARGTGPELRPHGAEAVPPSPAPGAPGAATPGADPGFQAQAPAGDRAAVTPAADSRLPAQAPAGGPAAVTAAADPRLQVQAPAGDRAAGTPPAGSRPPAQAGGADRAAQASRPPESRPGREAVVLPAAVLAVATT